MTKFYGLLCAIAWVACSDQTTNTASLMEAGNAPVPVLTAQTNPALKKAELTKIYAQAIDDYIKAVNKDYAIKFDTLYFGKHVYGQPDDFPDIELPETIEDTQVRLVSPEVGAQKQKDNKSSFFINLVGWVNEEDAEFIFIAFSNNNEHQFDYYLDYSYNQPSNTFNLSKTRFENFLYKKK